MGATIADYQPRVKTCGACSQSVEFTVLIVDDTLDQESVADTFLHLCIPCATVALLPGKMQSIELHSFIGNAASIAGAFRRSVEAGHTLDQAAAICTEHILMPGYSLTVGAFQGGPLIKHKKIAVNIYAKDLI